MASLTTQLSKGPRFVGLTWSHFFKQACFPYYDIQCLNANCACISQLRTQLSQNHQEPDMYRKISAGDLSKYELIVHKYILSNYSYILRIGGQCVAPLSSVCLLFDVVVDGIH